MADPAGRGGLRAFAGGSDVRQVRGAYVTAGAVHADVRVQAERHHARDDDVTEEERDVDGFLHDSL